MARLRYRPGGPIIRLRRLGESRSVEIPQGIPRGGYRPRISFINATNEIAVTHRGNKVYRRALYRT